MKKILITRKLIKESEDKASKTFNPIFNSNDELYSQSKVIEMSNGCDGILTSLTDKMDKDTIDKLPDTIKIISNFAVGFGNIDLEAAKKKESYKKIRSFNDTLIKKSLELNGTITGEHGVGLHKKEYLLEQHPDNIPVMKSIKRTLDPNNIMNPGKIFDLN